MTNQKSQYPSTMLNYLALDGICKKVGFICSTDEVCYYCHLRHYSWSLLMQHFCFISFLARWVSGISVAGASWGRQKANSYHRWGRWWLDSGFSSVKHGSNSLKTCGWEFIGGVHPMSRSTFATLVLLTLHINVCHVLGILLHKLDIHFLLSCMIPIWWILTVVNLAPAFNFLQSKFYSGPLFSCLCFFMATLIFFSNWLLLWLKVDNYQGTCWLMSFYFYFYLMQSMQM